MSPPAGPSRKAAFLDRDGVLNAVVFREGRPTSPLDLSELVIPAGVPEALGRLKAAGYELIVVTNQPNVARGLQSREMVDSIHEVLRTALSLDAIYACFHDDASGCECRKPKPGLLQRASLEREIDLSESVMIGDRWRDVEAGARAGCATIFLDFDYDEPKPTRFDKRASSLTAAVEWLVNRTPSRRDQPGPERRSAARGKH